MILFEHLFIIIARFYIKTWSEYKNWWVNVRYGITLLVFFNLLSIFAIIKDSIHISKLTFIILAMLFYLIISFIRPKLNDKEIVKDYETIEIWKKVSIGYIITSIIMFVLTFWFFVIGI